MDTNNPTIALHKNNNNTTISPMMHLSPSWLFSCQWLHNALHMLTSRLSSARKPSAFRVLAISKELIYHLILCCYKLERHIIIYRERERRKEQLTTTWHSRHWNSLPGDRGKGPESEPFLMQQNIFFKLAQQKDRERGSPRRIDSSVSLANSNWSSSLSRSGI